MKADRPSATAITVASNIAAIAATPQLSHLVPSRAAELTSLLLAAYRRRAPVPRHRPARMLSAVIEYVTIPGLALHQALRKRHIERIVRASLKTGFEQVVILGGGLDTLALRLHREFRAVTFLELDHPATQAPKRAVAESHALAGPNLHFCPVDLVTTALGDVLREHPAYDAARRSIFVCEGVLMYLESREVDELFDAIGQQHGARFIFTFMEPDMHGEPRFRNATWLVPLYLRLKREPFRWALPAAAAEEFLAARGWSFDDMATADTLREGHLHGPLRNRTLAEGEVICVADRTVPG